MVRLRGAVVNGRALHELRQFVGTQRRASNQSLETASNVRPAAIFASPWWPCGRAIDQSFRQQVAGGFRGFSRVA